MRNSNEADRLSNSEKGVDSEEILINSSGALNVRSVY
jgi:hypothetical protein